MPKTSRRQKAFLVLLGIFISLIVVELFLRGASLAYSFLQEKENSSLKNSDNDVIRILCVGDSMTALGRRNSYPAQLQEILNEQEGEQSFIVLNKGIVGKDSEGFTFIMDKLIAKYDPQIVIAMVGINDEENHYHPAVVRLERFLNNFRTFDLMTWIWHGIQVKLRKNSELSTIDPDDFEKKGSDFSDEEKVKEIFIRMQQQIDQLNKYLARQDAGAKASVKAKLEEVKRNQFELLLAVALYHRTRNDYAKAIGYLQSAIEFDRNNYLAYVELGRSLREMGKCQQAIPLLNRASQLGPISIINKLELARCYEQLGDQERAKQYYDSVYELSKITGRRNYSGDVGKWYIRNEEYGMAIEALQKTLEERPNDYHLYEQLAAMHHLSGDKDKASLFGEKGLILRQRAESFLPETVHNYNKIAEIVLGKGKRLIIMQYPLRRLAPLKNIFWNQEEILFVDNEQTFIDALEQGEFNEFFNDFFAGDFGHCTGKGNRLLAQNASAAVQKALLQE